MKELIIDFIWSESINLASVNNTTYSIYFENAPIHKWLLHLSTHRLVVHSHSMLDCWSQRHDVWPPHHRCHRRRRQSQQLSFSMIWSGKYKSYFQCLYYSMCSLQWELPNSDTEYLIVTDLSPWSQRNKLDSCRSDRPATVLGFDRKVQPLKHWSRRTTGWTVREVKVSKHDKLQGFRDDLTLP